MRDGETTKVIQSLSTRSLNSVDLVSPIVKVVRSYLVKVIDELSQIFNRVDIMMWRWRNKRDSGLGVSECRNIRTDFFTRQLTPFSWFSALSDFDFNLLSICQE